MFPCLGHVFLGFQQVISILHDWSYVNSITMMLRRRRRGRGRADDDDDDDDDYDDWEEELEAMKGYNDDNG